MTPTTLFPPLLMVVLSGAAVLLLSYEGLVREFAGERFARIHVLTWAMFWYFLGYCWVYFWGPVPAEVQQVFRVLNVNFFFAVASHQVAHLERVNIVAMGLWRKYMRGDKSNGLDSGKHKRN